MVAKRQEVTSGVAMLAEEVMKTSITNETKNMSEPKCVRVSLRV
jgi:hypothetical protein